MAKRKMCAILALALAGSLVLAPTAGAEPAGSPGAPGVGDPFFPNAGNGGYDVQAYQLTLDWEPSTATLTGSERVVAIATQPLTSFNLDLRGFAVGAVKVNGRAATVTRDGQELIITPARPLKSGFPFLVQLAYRGTPEVITDPDGSSEGWVPTDDGVFVVGEPQGSPGWFAVNDTPTDKARFDISMTVPDGLTAVGNGALVNERSSGGKTTFRWVERFPMAPYLTTITIGEFIVSEGRTPGGVPTYVAVDPSQVEAATPVLAKLPQIVDFFTELYGPYPFENVGAIVDYAPEVGYALETQTKPVYSQAPSESTLAHEIAHQWFGNAVTLSTWPDIWLNEGFATFSEWIWSEQTGGVTAQETFEALLAEPADSALWTPPTAAITDPADMFSSPAYDRGAMTLQALRQKVGDETMRTLLRTWYSQNRNGNVTTAQFIALSEQITGVDLTEFFDIWLYTPGKPTAW